VLLFGKDGRLEERSEETGVEGRFRMEGLEGIEYRLTAGRLPSGPDTESFARAEVGGLVPPRLDVVVRLTRATSVEGRVIDAAGRPLARAVVDARDAEGRDYQALSVGEGRFRLQVAAGAVLQIEGAWPGPGADAGDGRRRTGKLAEIAAGSRGNVLTLD
jgi:hypothetical protein